PLQGDQKPRPFLLTAFDEWAPKFSPNGRWIAYVSNESRRDEIYLQPVQGSGGKQRVSSDGGVWPAWARRGRELLFLNGNKVLVAKTDPESGIPSQATLLMSVSDLLRSRDNPTYDIAPDGKSFVMILQKNKTSPTQLNVIFNWFTELQQRVPVK